MEIEFISESPEYTLNVGKKLSSFLKAEDLLLFSGELGGGKTTFISGLAKGLGVSGDLSSPSFTILNQYDAGRLKLIHIDLYRLDGLVEFENIGLDEYIYDKRSISCIEWGEKAKDFVKKDFLMLDFEYILDDDSIDKRKIILKSGSPEWEKRLKQIEKVLNQK
jgi:tRNA threonylcarbamoyladenosine biosynthesis protein TsaE